jgi:hypothetical protein
MVVVSEARRHFGIQRKLKAAVGSSEKTTCEDSV